MRRIAGIVVLLLACSVCRAQVPSRNTPTDRAIDRGLLFLANSQDRNDGSWRANGTRNPAISSLAIMAFLSAGHVPGEGKYGSAIEKGVNWVMKQQQPNGLIASEGGHEMYHHGIATLMLAEVAGMTDGALAREVRLRLEKAVALIIKAQRTRGSARGGWRYTVQPRGGDTNDADISVTGWQIMALRGAKNLGCDVPPETIDQAVEYIKRCNDPLSGGYRYMPNHGVTAPCTGTSILALELCGKNLHRSPELLRAGSFLLRNPPRWNQGHFFYGIYYCAQATFQLGDNYWNSYAPQLREVLLRNQSSNGFWEGGDTDSRYGGPTYCTSMAILALTVEYRFLPIYQRSEETTEKPPRP